MTKREHAGRATGPRTATGKVKSSRNALKHGLSARRHLGNEEAQAIDDVAGRIAAELPWPVETAVIEEWVTCRKELANIRQVRADALRRRPRRFPGSSGARVSVNWPSGSRRRAAGRCRTSASSS